eukprot:Nitzschia sp. Nitz4//scaffold149_size55946//19209//19600//NITZ4_006592-RA/size55946-snap-gene-0.116-mRNA-1//-1//CDS//3329536803//8754//frame0
MIICTFRSINFLELSLLSWYNELTGTLPTSTSEFGGLEQLDGTFACGMVELIAFEKTPSVQQSTDRNHSSRMGGPPLSSLYYVHSIAHFPEAMCNNIASFQYLTTDWCFSKSYCCP